MSRSLVWDLSMLRSWSDSLKQTLTSAYEAGTLGRFKGTRFFKNIRVSSNYLRVKIMLLTLEGKPHQSIRSTLLREILALPISPDTLRQYLCQHEARPELIAELKAVQQTTGKGKKKR